MRRPFDIRVAYYNLKYTTHVSNTLTDLISIVSSLLLLPLPPLLPLLHHEGFAAAVAAAV
jgi:hypothetical protein